MSTTVDQQHAETYTCNRPPPKSLHLREGACIIQRASKALDPASAIRRQSWAPHFLPLVHVTPEVLGGGLFLKIGLWACPVPMG
jgi:hypothetical protein